MTDKQIDTLNDESENSQEVAPKLGELLKQAREAKKLSIDDVAKQLHLRPSIVREIEEDDFSNIASVTYVKGYVKNYTRFVEADKAAIETALAEYFPVEDAPTMQSFSRKRTREANEGRFIMLTYFIFFALMVLLVVWWVQKSDSMMGIDASNITAEEAAEIALDNQHEREAILSADEQEDEAQTGIEPEMVAEAVSVDQDVVSSESEPVVEINNTKSANVSEVVEEAEAQAVMTPAPVQTADSTLRMELTDDCWIKVTDSQGKTLVNGLRVSGSAFDVSGQEPFEVILGAPQAVKLIINGEDVDLAKYPQGKVARLTVKSSAGL